MKSDLEIKSTAKELNKRHAPVKIEIAEFKGEHYGIPCLIHDNKKDPSLSYCSAQWANGRFEIRMYRQKKVATLFYQDLQKLTPR